LDEACILSHSHDRTLHLLLCNYFVWNDTMMSSKHERLLMKLACWQCGHPEQRQLDVGAFIIYNTLDQCLGNT
jgi:hypothetical protein